MLKTHITLDLYMANPDILALSEPLKAALTKSCTDLNHAVRQENYIQFEPFGVTATVVSDLFHFSIHTWPEHCSCAIDLYSLRGTEFTRAIAEAFKENLEAKEYDIKILDRR